MKTFLEQQYDRAIITKLCTAELPTEQRIKYLTEFHAGSEVYYDNLCDALLAVSTGQNTSPIWITPTGDTYLSLCKKGAQDSVLLYPDEVPIFDFDLVNQLEVAILKI